MQGKPKEIYLVKEDSPYGCSSETSSSSYGHPWQVISQPLLWHWAVYDFLMSLFYTILFTVLFNNFV